MQFKSLRTRITVWTITAMLLIPLSAGGVIVIKQLSLAAELSKTKKESDLIFKETLMRDLDHAMMVNQLDGIRTLLRKVSGFKGIKSVSLLDSRGAIVMHYGVDDRPRTDNRQIGELLESGEEFEHFSQEGGKSVRLLALPIINKEECRTCHKLTSVNGALLVKQLSVDVNSETNLLVAIMLISLLVASLASAITLLTLLSRNVVVPIREISSATERVGQCDLNVKVPVYGKDEVGELAHSFNRMIDDLRKSRDEVEDRSVKCEQAYNSMQSAQKKLIQSEKLAAIGTLVAGIAHEINNPVGIIAARTDCMLMEMKDKGMEGQYTDDLMVINRQTGRIADITMALLTFARHGHAEMSLIDINSIVEDTIFLVGKQFLKEGIKMEKHLSLKSPKVMANGNRMQQVLLDLLNNARDAMPEGGLIIIATDVATDNVELTIADTGEGINDEALDNIFDPFFTTKEVGKGTGLGLAVSYGIIQDFGGNIEVISRKGEGSTFNITLPRIKES